MNAFLFANGGAPCCPGFARSTSPSQSYIIQWGSGLRTVPRGIERRDRRLASICYQLWISVTMFGPGMDPMFPRLALARRTPVDQQLTIVTLGFPHRAERYRRGETLFSSPLCVGVVGAGKSSGSGNETFYSPGGAGSMNPPGVIAPANPQSASGFRGCTLRGDTGYGR